MATGLSNPTVHIEDVIPYLKKIIASENNELLIKKFKNDRSAVVHLAIIVQPYLSRILSGEKTIESRYSINSIAPYNKIKSGDLVLLKKSGAEVIAIFEAGEVQYFSIRNQIDLEYIKNNYNEQLKIDEKFWELKKDCKYATLIEINKLWNIPQFKINKQNRSAWMTLGPISGKKESTRWK